MKTRCAAIASNGDQRILSGTRRGKTVRIFLVRKDENKNSMSSVNPQVVSRHGQFIEFPKSTRRAKALQFPLCLRAPNFQQPIMFSCSPTRTHFHSRRAASSRLSIFASSTLPTHHHRHCDAHRPFTPTITSTSPQHRAARIVRLVTASSKHFHWAAADSCPPHRQDHAVIVPAAIRRHHQRNPQHRALQDQRRRNRSEQFRRPCMPANST